MRKRLSLEKIVFILCCLGLLVTGYALLFSTESSRDQSKNSSVGFVRPVGRDIRVKGEADLSWSNVARDASVFKNDRVYTGKSSRAKVTLRSQEQFTVEPNSLVVITDGADRQIVEFSSGGLFAKLKSGAKLFVKYKDKETEYSAPKSATIRLSSSKDGRLNLVVLKGEAEVKRADVAKPEKVEAHSELEISNPQAQPIVSNITLLAPDAGQELWTKDNHVQFKWEKNQPGVARVEVSIDPEFSHIVASAELESNQANINLPTRDTYFWRVTSSDTKSVVSSFSLQALMPPVVNPFGEIEVETDSSGRSNIETYFTWNDQSASDEYTFELSEDPEFSRLTESRRALTTSIAIANLMTGRYFWRVRSKALGRVDLMSNTGELILREKGQPPVAMPIAKAPPATPQETIEPESSSSPLAQSKTETVNPVETQPESKLETKSETKVDKKTPTTKIVRKLKGRTIAQPKGRDLRKVRSTASHSPSISPRKEEKRMERRTAAVPPESASSATTIQEPTVSSNNDKTYWLSSFASTFITSGLAGGNHHIILKPGGTGNVGIGTTSPVFPLHVFRNMSGSDASIFIQNLYAGQGSSLVAEANSNHVSVALYGTGQAWSMGNRGSTTFTIHDLTASKTPLSIEANSPTNSIYVANSGNIGIGTTVPAYPLDVVGSIRSSTGVQVGTQNWITSFSGGAEFQIANGFGNGYIGFQTNNGVSTTEKVRITGSGNVGIGTTSPATRLDVVGAINSSAGFTVAGVPVGTSSDSYWNANGSDIHFSTGKVGVGTNTPAAKLQTAVTFAGGLDAFLISYSNGSFIKADEYGALNVNDNLFVGWDNNIGNYAFSSAGDTYITSGNSTGAVRNILLMPSGAGNVGIGTTNPVMTLDVNGPAQSNGIYLSPGADGVDKLLITNDGTWQSGIRKNVGRGFDIFAMYSGSNPIFAVNARGTYNTPASDQTRFIITGPGNVGIGTAVPKCHFLYRQES